MPQVDWRAALRAFLAFVAAVALWASVSSWYDGVVGESAERVIRAFEDPPVTRLRLAEDGYTTVDRADFDPRSKRPAMPIRDLTFNFTLLAALFAASSRPLSLQNLGGGLAGTGLLAVTHVFAAITEVMSIYSAKLGMWSRVNYSELEKTFWGVANHSYRLVLMYAIAFAIWFVLRPGARGGGKRAAAGSKKRR